MANDPTGLMRGATRTSAPTPQADLKPALAGDRFDLSVFQIGAERAEVAANDAQQTPDGADESDVTLVDLRPIEDMQPALAESLDSPAPEPQPRPIGPSSMAIAAALGWAGASLGAPTALVGWTSLTELGPVALMALGALAVLPPVVMLACSSAAREAYRARLEQHRLSRLARRMMLGPDEMQGRASAFGRSIRAEIDEINESMASALDRMAQLEAAAIRNAHAFEDAVIGARSGATALSEALNEERGAFAELNADLQEQTEQLGATVARQIRMMREASHLVRQETSRADQSLTANIAALATSTAALGDKTQELGEVVEAAAAGAAQFDETLVQALGALGEATKLNDAARQSAESSAVTAQTAAAAVRDASVRAATDARRVTEIIRAETKAMQDQAQATLDTLRAAAEEARRAAEFSEATAERYAAAPTRRAAPTEAPPVFTPRTAPRPQTRSAAFAAQAHAPNPANDIDPREALRRRAMRVIAESGVEIEHVFSTADLDYVAGRSKDGPSSRRRAVALAAMDAVERIEQRLMLDARAREDALAFRAHPEAATGEANRNALKAYLLLDAALG
jgi:hypothetical protein